MESAPQQMRSRLVLGKFHVVERGTDYIKIFLGGSTTMTIRLEHMHLYDIKDGDLLTYYCEVLLAPLQG
jgi:hypothetical protein